MTVDTTMVEVAVALFVGAGVAWWTTRRTLSRSFDLKLRRIAEMHRKQHEAVVDRLNASHALARKELEHQRNTVPRQIAVSPADQRSTVSRLEEQLKVAYAELDRLRLEVNGPAPVGRPKPNNGFADTQPFIPRQKALQR